MESGSEMSTDVSSTIRVAVEVLGRAGARRVGEEIGQWPPKGSLKRWMERCSAVRWGVSGCAGGNRSRKAAEVVVRPWVTGAQ